MFILDEGREFYYGSAELPVLWGPGRLLLQLQDRHLAELASVDLARFVYTLLHLTLVCTEWGYQMCGYSDGRASMISKRVSYESLHYVCKQAFPPGDLYSIPEQPNIDSVNSIGGYELARDRLAFIDGEGDPWREATIHSANFAKPRVSTDTRPNYLIPHGGHCYDLYQDTVEPKYMEDTHKFIYNFMDKWLDEWKASQP